MRHLFVRSLFIVVGLAPGARLFAQVAPYGDYLQRGTIEFTQESNQAFSAGTFKQYRTVRKESPCYLKVRYNALALALNVKGTNIFPTVQVPSALSNSGLVTTEALTQGQRGAIEDTIQKLNKVIEVGTEAFAAATADSPPLTDADARKLSEKYVKLFNRTGLAGDPKSMVDAKSQVDDLVASNAGTVTDARNALQSKIAELQESANKLGPELEGANEASARAADVINDLTIDLKTENNLITRYTAASGEAANAMKDAETEKQKAIEAQMAAKDPAAIAAAQAQVAVAQRKLDNAKADKDVADAQLKAAKKAGQDFEDKLAAATMDKEQADQAVRAKQREIDRNSAEKGRVQESLNSLNTDSGPLAALITNAKECAGFIYDCACLHHLYSVLQLDARGNDMKVEISFDPRTPAASSANGGAPDPNGPPTPSRLPAARTVTGDIFPPGTNIFPIDFGPFRSISPSYSVGLVYTDLRDEHPRSVADSDGTFTIFPGARSEATVKPIALLHLNIYKSGGFYTGPALGVVGSNQWLGWGMQLGRVNDRLSLDLGYEFGSVARLNGVSYGPGQPRGSDLTSNVNRHKFAPAVTYSFKIGG